MVKNVEDVMTKDVECIGQNDTLREAAEKMRTLNVGPLPVCEGDKPVGIITDRDIVVRAVSQGLDPNSTPVSMAMTGDVETVFQDEDIEIAMKTMRDEQIRRILVVDRDGKLAGIVSLADIATELDRAHAGKTLEAVSEPSQPATH